MGLKSLILVWFIFVTFSLAIIVYADYQVDALNAFRQKISNDSKNALLSWDTSLANPCTWWHITCDKDTENVIKIDLGGAGLWGQLVPELGNLNYLQNLELYDNNLYGSIPAEIGNLSNLINLDLYNNILTGPIPDTLGKLTKLKSFLIQLNSLSGPIPVAMASFNLTYMSIAFNPGLCGPFTARCIDSNDPKKCTDDYSCPCRCGPTFTTPCDYNNIPHCNTTICCWN